MRDDLDMCPSPRGEKEAHQRKYSSAHNDGSDDDDRRCGCSTTGLRHFHVRSFESNMLHAIASILRRGARVLVFMVFFAIAFSLAMIDIPFPSCLATRFYLSKYARI